MAVKPFDEDFLNQIVGVQFGSGGVFVLQLRYSTNHTHLPGIPMVLASMPWQGGLVDAFAGIPRSNIQPVTPLLSTKFMWAGPTRTVIGADTDFKEAIIFFSLRKIFSILPKNNDGVIRFDIVPTVAPPTTDLSTTYWVWFNFGDAFPGVEPNTYFSNVAFDSVWDNLPDAQARAASLGTPPGSSHHVETLNEYSTNPGVSSWRVHGETYDKNLNFPVSPIGTPLWSAAPFQQQTMTNGDNQPHHVRVEINMKPGNKVAGGAPALAFRFIKT